MQLVLYDTLSRSLKEVPFPKAGSRFRMYCCGPTVYAPAHIGNFRTFIVQDVLRRVLELLEYRPLHVRNLTDVDDKTIRNAQAEGITLQPGRLLGSVKAPIRSLCKREKGRPAFDRRRRELAGRIINLL